MGTVTLAESAKLTQDMLLAGVIENVVTTNPIYQYLPFMEIEGNALAYNRENALGDVQYLAVGGTITAKNPATFTKVTSSLTTLVGDAEVNGLIQATRSDYVDQKAVQIASKAKSLGRQYQNTMVNGDGTSDTFSGMLTLCSAGQKIAVGGAYDFGDLDELMDKIKDKDGQVDYFMMPARSVRSYYSQLRAVGGASINEVITLPSGQRIPMYRGVPIFTNDWIPTNGGAGSDTTIFAGTFDDGSGTHGIAGLSARGAAGMRVTEVGEKETADETITRVKMYCGMAVFSLLGLTGVTN
jgi:HK97 family phage major capsid protein